MWGPENTTWEIGSCGCDTAVLGIGSFEQHAAHLPLDTDFFFAGRISLEVAGILGAILLPPLPYSTSLEHRGFAGTVTLKPETLKAAIWDIAESAGDWGIRTLALINAHGGNFILIPTARQWNMDRRLPRLLLVDYCLGLTGTQPNLHACEVETSLMLHLASGRVRMDRRVDFVPPSHWGREDLTHLGMKALSPQGVWGYPSRASPEKGARWFQEAVDYCVRRIRTLRQALEGPEQPTTT